MLLLSGEVPGPVTQVPGLLLDAFAWSVQASAGEGLIPLEEGELFVGRRKERGRWWRPEFGWLEGLGMWNGEGLLQPVGTPLNNEGRLPGGPRRGH